MSDGTRNAAEQLELIRGDGSLAPYSHLIVRRMQLFENWKTRLAGLETERQEAWGRVYGWKHRSFSPRFPLLVYDCGRAGMGSNTLVQKTLPFAAGLGYNALLLGLPASAAGDVANAYKGFVDEAHSRGVAVILCVDSTPPEHYGEPKVLQAKLLTLQRWLKEYKVDGFCFTGLPAALYHDGGAGGFGGPADYFTPNANLPTAVYLMLAAEACREVNPCCILLAEDDSGMPGIALPAGQGGFGFSHWLVRPDPAKGASMTSLWETLSPRRRGEARIAACPRETMDMVTRLVVYALAGDAWLGGKPRPAQKETVKALLGLAKAEDAWRATPELMVCDDWYKRLYFRRGKLLFCCNFNLGEAAPLPAIAGKKTPLLYVNRAGKLAGQTENRALPPGTAAVFLL